MMNEVTQWLAQVRMTYFWRRHISVTVKRCGYGGISLEATGQLFPPSFPSK